MSIKPFKEQNYYELIESHSVDNLFEDPHFPANDSSMYYSRKPPNGICWRRPNVKNNLISTSFA